MGETRVIALGQQAEAHAGDVGKPLISLQACEPKGRSAFEGEQVTRMAHELCDDLLGCRLGRRRSGRGRWAWTGRDRGLFYRAWHQTCHGQDTPMAGWPLGFLAEQVAYLLAFCSAPPTTESHTLSRHGA